MARHRVRTVIQPGTDLEVDDYELAELRAQGLLRSIEGKATPRTAGVVLVHGEDPNVPRPPTAGPVVWYGTVEPAHSSLVENDVWVKVEVL